MNELSWVMAATTWFSAFVVAAVSVPMVRRRIAPNRWYGIRIRRAFTSDEAWYEINHFGGKVLLRLSVVVAAAGFLAFVPPFSRSEPWAAVIGMIPLLYLVGLIPILRFAARFPDPD